MTAHEQQQNSNYPCQQGGNYAGKPVMQISSGSTSYVVIAQGPIDGYVSSFFFCDAWKSVLCYLQAP
jgi:hypothetical protein